MRVRVLGGLTVERIAERQLGSRKGRTILKVLVLARGQPVSTDTLAEILWGDSPPAWPSEQVSVLVSRLRGVLGADRIPRTDAGYSAMVDWLDIDEIADLVAAGANALAEGKIGPARAAADAALSLARGPVVPDEDGIWVEAERAAAEAELALTADQTVPAGTAAPTPAAFGFVGRAAELALLDRALAEAAAGATPVVLVEGEAGIGKSTLVGHWAERARSRRAAVLRGRCDELGRDLPLQPISDALAAYLRTAGAERAGACCARPSRHDTRSPASRPGNVIRKATTSAFRPASSAAERAAVTVAIMGAAVLRAASYHGFGRHPRAASAASTAPLTG